MMTAAELGLYNTSGPSIAIGVAIALLAGLTLTPAMLTILGDHAFWPRKARHMKEAGLWHAWAGKVVKTTSRRSSGAGDRAGAAGRLRQRARPATSTCWATSPKTTRPGRASTCWPTHLGPGEMQPLNVVAIDPHGFDTAQGLARTKELRGHAGRARPRDHRAQLHRLAARPEDPERRRPAGGAGARRARGHRAARDAGRQRRRRGGRRDPAACRAAPGGGRRTDRRLRLPARSWPRPTPRSCRTPGTRRRSPRSPSWPSWPQTPARRRRRPQRDRSASLEQAAHRNSSALADGLEALQGTFAARPDAILLPDLYLESNEGLKALRDAYISADGTATRLQVVLDAGPYSPEAVATVQTIRADPERRRASRAWSRATPPCSSICGTPPTGT